MNQALIPGAGPRAGRAARRGHCAALPPIAIESGWANFVRNHDELSLDKLSEEERQEVFAAFGPDEGMQMYGRGIRRRLPTMLNGDERRLRLVYSLMFALPGIPTLFYGEEIGLAENLASRGATRCACRCSGRTSRTAASPPPRRRRCAAPPSDDPRYAAERLNVAAQRRDPNSLLNWMERLIRQRKERPEIGWGQYQLVETAEPAVFAHRCDWDESAVLIVHNLDRQHGHRRRAPRPGRAPERNPRGQRLPDRSPRNSDELEIAGYGYRWFRIRRDGQRILA